MKIYVCSGDKMIGITLEQDFPHYFHSLGRN